MYQHINSEACLSVFESKRRRKDGAGDGDNGAKVILQPREPLPRRKDVEPEPPQQAQPETPPSAPPATASTSSASSSRQMTLMTCTAHIS